MRSIFLMIFLTAIIHTAETAELSGVVLDSLSRKPIVGVSVQVESVRIGTMTDSAGIFLIDLPVGHYDLLFTHVGYQKRLIKETPSPGSIQLSLMPRIYERRPLEVVADPDVAVRLHREPAFVTVLALEKFEGQATSVSEVLSSAAGVQVKRLGGLGAFSTVSIRGSSSEQVDVYLDGVPLNVALGGGVDLGNLPLAQIDQVEVYRGAGAGGGGLGGAVHIRTRTAPSGVRFGSSGSWGSFGTRGANAVTTWGGEDSEFLALFDFSTSANRFAFLDDNGTEYNVADDAITTRQNGDFASASILGKGQVQPRQNWTFAVSENLYWKHLGIPGISNNQSEHARLNSFRSLMEVNTTVSELWNRWTFGQRIFFLHNQEAFFDPEGEIGVGRQDNRYRTQSFGGQAHLAGDLSEAMVFELKAGVSTERFRPEDLLRNQTRLPQSKRHVFEIHVGIDQGFGWGTLSIASGAVKQNSQIFEESPFGYSSLAPDTLTTRLLFRFRAGLRIDLSKSIWLKANAGRSHRAPGFYELFGDRGGILGNTDLEPEHGMSWDFGFRRESDSFVFEGVYFEQHYDDLIQFAQTSQGVSRPYNVGQARVRGLEWTTQIDLLRSVTLAGNYTYQEAVDRSEIPHQINNRLPNRPTHEFNGRAHLKFGRMAGFYDYSFDSGNFTDRANLRSIPARHIHNLGLSTAILKRLKATFEAKNIQNTQIADQWGYPLPGRMYSVTVQEQF